MRGATRYVVLGVLVVVVIYDIIAYAIGGVGVTVSRVTLAWSEDVPIILVAVGVVIGHLFWPQQPKKDE